MPYIIKDEVRFLSEASKILSSSLDYNKSLASIGKLLVTNIADFCIIDVFEEGKIKRVTVRVADAKKRKLANRFFDFPPDPANKRAIYDAAQSSKPILIKKVTKDWLSTISQIKEERDVVQKLGMKSLIFAPMKSRDRVVGVLTIASFSTKVEYDINDRNLVHELASRAGTTIDKARLYSEAQEALRTRDEFLSIASHELRTPLTSILLNIQLILRRIRKTSPDKIKIEDIVKMLERSEQQSYRLARLITDLLNISIVSTGRSVMEKEQVDLRLLIKETVGRFEIQLKQAKMRVILRGERKIIGNWDNIRLEQVISNLISNAIKYGRRKPVTMELITDGNKATLKVTDQGIGIKKKDLPHIFDRFKRGVQYKDYRGLGVGLYICKQIVEAHEGKIWAESKLGKGSTFTVELPL